MKSQSSRTFWYTLVIVWSFIALHVLVVRGSPQREHLPYSEFQTHLKAGQIAEVRVLNEQIEGTFKKPLENGATRFVTVRVPPELATELASQEVVFSGERTRSFWSSVMINLLPFAVLLLIWMVMMRGVMGKSGIGGRGLMTIGKSKAKVYVENTVKTSFNDVAGVEEAKTELQEVVEFLKTPEKYVVWAGKSPKAY